jgi:DNA-binding CsgD family transcriptional regulator
MDPPVVRKTMAGLKETYERLRERDRQSPLEPQELLELATVAFLVGKDDESVTMLRRAQQGFVQQGNLRRAGGIAARISSILINGGNTAQAAGWLARAARLLDESGDPGVERGYLLVAEARHSIVNGRLEQAADKFAEAAAIGERFRDADLTSLARQGHGRVLIERGEIERGVALLDEAMVAATAGELSTIIAGIVYCSVLSACADLFDVGRAREWTQALTRWCDAQPEMVPYRGECLVHRAEVILLRGVWLDALHHAEIACEQLGEPPGQPAFGAALYQVAELHRLRGELDAAERAYRRVAESGRTPYPGLALLRLAQGRRQDAAASIARALQEVRPRRARTRIACAAVEIMLACGDLAAAREAGSELDTHARTLRTPFVRAAAAHAHGAIALAAGDATTALASGRTALTLWCELEVPYEGARARVLIAQAYRALGDKDSADLELETACRTFEQLGAKLDLACLRPPETTGHNVQLTPRELQVLRLVATGRTNRSIGDALQLSEKTVARHVANICLKLDVSSRTAATAYAFEHGLISPST